MTTTPRTDTPIEACLTVDDFPVNGTYIRRAQCEAMGFPMPQICDWSHGWPRQADARFMSLPLVHRFTNLVEELNLRGKFTLLPCPGGLGRLDQSVRGLPDTERTAILDLIRKRVAPRFDLSLEVLTHAMALDTRTGALLPHTESAWVSHLAAPGPDHHEQLCAYLRFGWHILANLGFTARCVTIGGMPDVSGITDDHMLHQGHHLDRLADAIRVMRSEFVPGADCLFIFAATLDTRPPNGRPCRIKQYPDAFAVYDLQQAVEESLLGVFHGEGDIETEAAKLVTPDLSGGTMIEAAESGKVLSFLVHAQTLASRNTGMGLGIFQLACTRLRERYGKRLVWRTPTELAQRGLVNT